MSIAAEKIAKNVYLLRAYDGDPQENFEIMAQFRAACVLVLRGDYGEIKGAIAREEHGLKRSDILDLIDLGKLMMLNYYLIDRELGRRMPLANPVMVRGRKMWRIDL